MVPCSLDFSLLSSSCFSVSSSSLVMFSPSSSSMPQSHTNPSSDDLALLLPISPWLLKLAWETSHWPLTQFLVQLQQHLLHELLLLLLDGSKLMLDDSKLTICESWRWRWLFLPWLILRMWIGGNNSGLVVVISCNVRKITPAWVVAIRIRIIISVVIPNISDLIWSSFRLPYQILAPTNLDLRND